MLGHEQTLSPGGEGPVTADHLKAMGEGVPSKVLLCPEGKGGGQTEQCALSHQWSSSQPPIPPGPSAASASSLASRLSQFAWLRPEYFQEGDDITELGFQKAGVTECSHLL